MSLITRVKVGNVSSLSEARYCAGMGVDFLGFRIGAGGLSPQAYQDIINWISVPHLVLEAHRDNALTLEDITNHFPGHYIEINKDQLAWLDAAYSFILRIKAADWPSVAPSVRGRKNLSYVEIDPDGADIPTLTAFPLIVRVANREDLELAMRTSAAAISLDGSKEERPGLMDYGFVGEVLETLSEG